MKLKSRAKINLSIDILGKRSDGYHLVEMIMQSIDLCDYITINENDEDVINIRSSSEDIPLNDENIVYKATKLMKDTFNIDKGIDIYIEKNIPIAGGLAGGSGNCAAALVGLNRLWNLNLDYNNLKELGLKLGADVPFCINGGCVVARNIGEELESIDKLSDKHFIVICKPEIFVSTKEVYESLDLNNLGKRPNTKKLIESLQNDDITKLSNNMANVLENITSKKHKEIDDIKSIMKECGCLTTMMSGSGPTVFGIFNSTKEAEYVKYELLKIYKQVYITNSSDKGVEIIE